jgi:hypothetical protein
VDFVLERVMTAARLLKRKEQSPLSFPPASSTCIQYMRSSVFRIRSGFSADPDPDPALQFNADPERIRIQHFRSMRIQIRIEGFDDQKLEKINS